MISPATPLEGGSDSLRWKKLPHQMMTAGEKETPTESFPADATATMILRGLKTSTGQVVPGALGSAPQINREADRIAYLRGLWKTSTEDGESAHIAGCAALFHVPVAGIRIIGGTPGETAALALQFVEAWR